MIQVKDLKKDDVVIEDNQDNQQLLVLEDAKHADAPSGVKPYWTCKVKNLEDNSEFSVGGLEGSCYAPRFYKP